MEVICRNCKIVQTVALLCCVVPLVAGFAAGPPESACADLRTGTEQGAFKLEGHTSSAQNFMYNGLTSPFWIRVTGANVTYERGADVTVSVVANQTSGRARYTGVMLQARVVTCASADGKVVLVEDEPIGRFYSLGTTRDALLQPMKCPGGEEEDVDNTLAHVSPQWKIDESATWRVPEKLRGHIVFRATIVQDVTTHWTEQNSRLLLDPDLLLRGVPRCAGAAHHPGALLLAAAATVALLLRLG